MMTFDLDVSGLIDDAEKLAKKAQKAARPAAQAGAQVLYDQVRTNVAGLGRHTGNLASAIYQVYSASNSDDTRKVYHVSWNAKKAPHGWLVEYGYIKRFASYIGRDGKWHTNPKVKLAAPKQVPGKAFVRRAESAIPAAEAAMQARFEEEMSK